MKIMTKANCYREQARVFLQWASETADPNIAYRFSTRAQELIVMAKNADALDIFNASQMTGPSHGVDAAQMIYLPRAQAGRR